MARKNHPEIVGEIVESKDGSGKDIITIQFSLRKILELHLRTIGIGTKVRVEIVKWYKKRTGKQNDYLWSLVYPTILHYILEKTGQKFSAEDLHDRYKKKFLGYEVCEIMPDLVKVKSSTETNTIEFTDEFVELICVEWADNGLFIPPPDPKWREKQNA